VRQYYLRDARQDIPVRIAKIIVTIHVSQTAIALIVMITEKKKQRTNARIL